MMHYVKVGTYIFLLAILFSSCELFGGGGGNGDDEACAGEVVWRLENQQENLIGTKPLIKDGVVYFIQDGHLKAYTLEEGNRNWSIRIIQEGRTGGYSHTILESGNKLFLDQGFTIQAHSKQDGRILWKTVSTNDPKEVSGIGEPIMSQDEDYLYAGRKGYVLKVRKEDGQVIRRYPLDRLVPEGVLQGATEPIISPFGDDILYVPASYYDRTTPGEEEFGANMFAFEASTGNIIWQTRVEYAIDDIWTEMPGDSVIVSPPIYDIEVTESYIIGLQGRSVIALDRRTGQMQWYNNFPESGFDVGLAVEGNGVYAASVGSFAHKLDLQTGEELWRRDIRFSNTSIPTVRNGRLYFNNSGGGGIWVLNTADGSVIYNQEPPGHDRDSYDVYILSLGVGEDYMVNVGSKAVYCLKVP